MSTKKGRAVRSRPQKHQNTFAFKHNPKSKLTKKILSTPNEGVCNKCYEVIEWKKKYRKYKPLTSPKKCLSCELRKIKLPYHIICEDCSIKDNLCAKCKKAPIEHPYQNTIEDEEDVLNSPELKLMTERQRRTFLRNLNKRNKPKDQKNEEDNDEDDENDSDIDEEGSNVSGDDEGYESFEDDSDIDDPELAETIMANKVLKNALLKSKKIEEQLKL